MSGRNTRRPADFLPKRGWFSVVTAAAVVCLLVVLLSHDAAMTGVQGAFAFITNGILRLFGEPTMASGNVVRSNAFGVTVVTACTGLFTTALFIIAVLVYPTGWGAKVIGAAVGIGGIFVLNLVRLVSLYYIGLHLPGFLDQAHQLIWQSLLIVFAVTLWLVWAGRWARGTKTG